MFIENEHIWRAFDELETNALLFVDDKGVIRNINRGVTTLFGYSAQEIIGENVEILLSRDIRETHKILFLDYIRFRTKESKYKSKLVGVQRTFPATVDVQVDGPKRFSVIHKNQQEIPVTLTINEVWADSDDLVGFIAIIQNNTDQYTLQQKLQYQTAHDEHTGLINWQELTRWVYAGKKGMIQKNIEYNDSILYLDIDYFRTITYLSQKVGDSALQKVATWLLNNTRQEEDRGKDFIVAHFVADEFIIYLSDTPLDGALTLANRLKSGFRELNLRTPENPFFTSVSIGVSKVNPSTTLQDAVSQASNACRVAKEKGKNRIKVEREEDASHLKLEPVIREALKSKRLKLHAQKIIAISPAAQSIDNNRAHYEVLSRMKDIHGNVLSPVSFIPAAEKLGIAVTIDKYVIENTLELLHSNAAHMENLSLCSINLSGVSVSDEGMLQFIEHLILQNGIDPRKLCFEVTETYEIQDNDIAINLVNKLRHMGCKIAFDDFGIGYSNYQSFSRLPVDIVKIDGSYVRHLLVDHQVRTDVEGMINSAKARGLEIVAEYAESEELIAELEKLGVDYAQGYHFGKPMPLESLMAETDASSL